MFLCVFFAGENLSHQLSTCSAVSLPSKIDNICSDNELGDADDQDYEIDDEDNDDYDDGFTAYDDEDYNSDGDSGARSTAEVLNDNTENLPSQNHIYVNGRKSPNRKLGQRYMFIKSNIDTKVVCVLYCEPNYETSSILSFITELENNWNVYHQMAHQINGVVTKSREEKHTIVDSGERK